MKNILDKKDAFILAIFFVIALSIWVIPSLSSPTLFGEGDSYWHYGQSDYILNSDHVSSKLPYSYINKYFLYNPALGPLAREYPPIIHINYALVMLGGSNGFIPLGIFKAITSILAFLGIYILSKSLFSREVAIFASFGVLFSNRVFSTFLFWQHPSTISFVFIPLILYAFYQFIKAFYLRSDFNKHLLIVLLLLLSQFLLHIQGVFISLILLGTITFMFVVRITVHGKKKLFLQLLTGEKI